MTDDEFVSSFEDRTLPAAAFHHRDHVRLAWIYLRRHSALEALARFAEGLKRFAAFNGHPGLYHETITWAYLFLIHERMAGGAERGDLGGVRGAQPGPARLEAVRARPLLRSGDPGLRAGAAHLRAAPRKAAEIL